MIDFQNGSIFKLKQTNPDSVMRDIAPLLVNGEDVLSAYKGLRDYVVFTNKRAIAVNVQGVTGKKKDFTSLPYSKIQAFSSETAGVFDMDSELELYFSGLGKVKFEFSGTSNIVQLSQVIGSYILQCCKNRRAGNTDGCNLRMNQVLKEIVGHEDNDITDHYTHCTVEDLQEGIVLLDYS